MSIVASGPATMHGRTTQASVSDPASAVRRIPSSWAFWAEYGWVGVPRAGTSSVSGCGLSAWNP
jgi:hypothetical protein